MILMRAETEEIPEEKCRQLYNESPWLLERQSNGSISNLVCVNSTNSDTCQGKLSEKSH